MILFLSDGRQIRGDLIRKAVLRSDLAPIPRTLEAEINSGDEIMDRLLAEGQTLTTEDGDKFFIVKSEHVIGTGVRGEHLDTGNRITALLEAALPAAYVRSSAVIKENCSLAGAYRAVGATIRSIEGDFPVPRFYCPIGETPTYHIARILQEEGGVVRWKNNRMKFFTLQALTTQKVFREFAGKASDKVQTGFLERHTVPWFFSLTDSGTFLFGNRAKARRVSFSPFKTSQRLRNMTRCLVQKKVVKLALDIQIAAGDLLLDTVDGEKYVVLTVAHVFEAGADTGSAPNTYSRVWLGQVEE